ncbi:hypothetical protein ACFVU3_09145 [Streptomyces sp. NPDC058052]|uniref:hypothetical protein n=1 Tax=Streptomyces sp. NPDC058052 TaxID=3346316 RepID=UPI0036EB14D4
MTCAGRSSDYSRFRVRRAVRAGAGILVGVLALPCLVLAGGGAARAGGAGDKALRLSVGVNGRAYGEERPTPVRAGSDVVKRYRLVNRGGADLYGVRVRDPGNPAGAVVRCPRRILVGLTSMECVVRFRALPGTRTATVRAEGRIPSLGLTAAATARAGYTGVAASLVLGERVSEAVPPPVARAGRAGRAAAPLPVPTGRATLAYTVTNRGNRALYGVRVTDPALRLSAGGVDCGGRPGLVPVLAPGASARCTATVRRPAGTHRSTGLATGTDRVGTYGPDGRLLPAPLLTARAGASFRVPEPARAADPGEAVAGVSGAGESGAGESGAGESGGAGGSVRPGAGPAAPPAAGRPAPGAPGAPGNAAGAGATAGAGAGTGAGTGAGAGAAAVPPPGGALPVGPPAPDVLAAPGAAGAGAGAAAGAGAGVVGAGPEPVGAGVPGGVGGEGRVEAPPAVREAREPREAREAAAGVGEAPAGLGRTPPEDAHRAAALDDEGFLGRLRRRGREADEMGVVVMLLLILVPAALAAALLGNRRT